MHWAERGERERRESSGEREKRDKERERERGERRTEGTCGARAEREVGVRQSVVASEAVAGGLERGERRSTEETECKEWRNRKAMKEDSRGRRCA